AVESALLAEQPDETLVRFGAGGQQGAWISFHSRPSIARVAAVGPRSPAAIVSDAALLPRPGSESELSALSFLRFPVAESRRVSRALQRHAGPVKVAVAFPHSRVANRRDVAIFPQPRS